MSGTWRVGLIGVVVATLFGSSCPLWAADPTIPPSSTAEETPGEKVASEDKLVSDFHAVVLGGPEMKLYRSASR